ncbi:nucleotidyltransferase family protein [Sphaerisporangium corydalis]|uniref:Sugar phosphate nucleotidyltransferase n=1 Tax=Sphaerisporangium corydalis TaxID=1441875 RepID=A0ABV9EKY9_9ACTN|nr:NDP-sugar synthase [Sphaerisporangium corydalis]
MRPPVRGIALVGGKGIRARPLTLTTPDYLRSKAAMRLVGRSLVEWAVELLRAQGVTDFRVAANGSENRCQTKAILGDGARLGVSVHYSRPRFDPANTGSGHATLRCLDHWDLNGLALVFPTDSVFDFDLAAMVRRHRETGASVTVATVPRSPAEAAGKYGVLVSGGDGIVTRFAEKPSMESAERLARGGALETNAGMYLIDCQALRMAARRPALAELGLRRLDWGGDLLPYLISAGSRVASHPIARFGDLGTPEDFLRTMREVLRDEYPAISARMWPATGQGGGVRIHESSLDLKDEVSGRSLAEKIRDGVVRIGPGVRIGRDVEIGPGVVLAHSDVADGVDIGEGARLHGVACGEHSIVGPRARLSDSVIGTAVEIRAGAVLEEFCALGDEVSVHAGVHLRGVSVFPRLDVWSDARVPDGACLVKPSDVLRWSHRVA